MATNILTNIFNKAISDMSKASTSTPSAASKSTGISPTLAQKAVDIGNAMLTGTLSTALPGNSSAIAKVVDTAVKSMNKKASSGAVANPVANPVAASTGYDMQAVTDALNRVIQNQEAAAAQQAEQRAKQQAAVAQILSPENFKTLLTQALANYDPLIESNKESLTAEANELARLIDIDAEQRGIYNSGMANVNQSKNLERLNQAIQAMRAQIQAQAVGDVKDIQNQGLQAIGMQGDWTTADSSNTLNTLKALLGANMDIAGLGLDKYKTDAQIKQEQQKINQEQQKMDQDYIISIGNLALNKAQLDQRASEFIKEMEFNEQKRLDSIDQFAKSLGLQKEQLTMSHKADMANSLLRSKELELSTRRFESEQDLIKAQLTREELEDQAGAYTMLSTLISNKAPMSEIELALLPYKTLYPKLYEELIATAKKETASSEVKDSWGDVTSIKPIWIDGQGNERISTPPPGYVKGADGIYRQYTPTPPATPTPK